MFFEVPTFRFGVPAIVSCVHYIGGRPTRPCSPCSSGSGVTFFHIWPMATNLPYFAKGKIVEGFGRGSKDLGFPTANFPNEVTEKLPADFACGIYYGWSNVESGPVHKMVMSIGFNPFYNNTHKTMETHILHEFPNDLHGSLLKICICGYLRPEKNFNSLDDLISAIREDVRQAKEELEKPNNAVYKDDKYFIQET